MSMSNSRVTMPMVTLTGTRGMAGPEFKTCVRSWSRAAFAESIHVVSDGTLVEGRVESFDGGILKAVPPEECEARVRSELKNLKSLQEMRKRSVMYRKVVDIPLWFRDEPRIAYVDTDIFFLRPVLAPDGDHDLLMGVDDATSYSGSWRIATEQRALPGLNAGFLIYKPGMIDFEFLDFLARRYFLQSRSSWLAEQPIWAILMAKWEKTGLFDGRDVRVIGGLGKRSRKEILDNQFVWLRKGKAAKNESEVRPLIDGAAVAHLAGSGKAWVELCEREAGDKGPPVPLRVVSPFRSTPGLRLATAARIATTEFLAAIKRRLR